MAVSCRVIHTCSRAESAPRIAPVDVSAVEMLNREPTPLTRKIGRPSSVSDGEGGKPGSNPASITVDWCASTYPRNAESP